MATFNTPWRGTSKASLFNGIIICQTGRQLFVTTNNVLGLGPRGIELGDVVCVFDGARTPHILRTIDNAEGSELRYSLIGEAYLHGYMYGEVEDLEIEEEFITLV